MDMVMNEILLQNDVLKKILSYLSMKEKTQVRLVCRLWKDLAEELLKEHKTLGMTSRRHFIMEDVDMGLPIQEMCKRHPIPSDDVISIPVYMPSNSQMILLKSALKML